MNAKTLEILNIHDDMGTAHDFKMFKESAAEVLPEDIIVLGDSGYQGMAECLANAIIPYKASKNHKLTDEEKLYNRMVSGQRIAIEHINREIKIFRIEYPRKPIFSSSDVFGLLKFCDTILSQKSGGEPQKTSTFRHGEMYVLDFPWELRICKEVYRGKGKRGLLRVRLIASLYNHRIAS